jgi:broad specificity phosphatase PhoE
MGARVSVILTSNLARTQETAVPLAARSGAALNPVPLTGGVGRYVEATVAAVRRAPKESTVLVVGHSNTVPLIARALGFGRPPTSGVPLRRPPGPAVGARGAEGDHGPVRRPLSLSTD